MPMKPSRKRLGIVKEAETEIATQVEQDATRTLMVALTPRFHSHGSPEIKYTDDVPERIFQMLARQDGILFTKKLVAAHLGIHRDTLHQWEKTYPRVSDAIAQGLAVQEAYLANLMSGGMKYSASVYAVLKNLHDWRDKTDETHRVVDFREAMKRASQGAKRVDWDKEGKAMKERIIRERLAEESQATDANLPATIVGD